MKTADAKFAEIYELMSLHDVVHTGAILGIMVHAGEAKKELERHTAIAAELRRAIALSTRELERVERAIMLAAETYALAADGLESAYIQSAFAGQNEATMGAGHRVLKGEA